ncbi:MAG: hypothetical protein A3F46_00345 [Legionellales bacterium RIFCSPHIGHO2_12_FULL_42_9]|nr:MAG: hypothetical protein A3F46_00345 [Legionellales bacterium RIFCSPHIGHO2_12_FULL_42_9]
MNDRQAIPMKEFDELLISLYQTLSEDPAVARDSSFINCMLNDQKLRQDLLLRLRVVQLLAVIKYRLMFPIENRDVEKSLLAGIEAESNALKLKPALTKLFFQTVIARSKALQYELFELLQSGSEADSWALYDEFIGLLKKDQPQYHVQWGQLAESEVRLSDKLQVCRQLIQQATYHGLQTMEELFNPTKVGGY